MLHFLDKSLRFPDSTEARADGLLAVGGDLNPQRLLLAYRSGIFPWFSDGDPPLWWCPDPRMVLFPAEFKRSKSLRKSIRTGGFSITQNSQFEAVIRACAEAPRPDQLGTWITEEMVQAYVELHRMGHAHSVEVWYHDELVGGLYGIDLPEFKVFCGESMFSKRTDASKVGFSFLVASLLEQNYKLIDCQLYTDHLASLGAREIARQDFLGYLKK